MIYKIRKQPSRASKDNALKKINQYVKDEWSQDKIGRNTRLIRNRSKILQEIFDTKRLYRKEEQDLQNWLEDTERPIENYLFGQTNKDDKLEENEIYQKMQKPSSEYNEIIHLYTPTTMQEYKEIMSIMRK